MADRMAEVMVRRDLFQVILRAIAALRLSPPAVARLMRLALSRAAAAGEAASAGETGRATQR